MWRGIFFFLKLAVVVAVAVWLAETPGRVAIDWQGYRIETSVGILLLAGLVAAVLAVLGHRLWRTLRGSPHGMGSAWRARREAKGRQALTQGMVSVAAGEVAEAQKHARRADRLLSDSSLTRLLSAQAAQINGDTTAARRSFTAMVEDPETRFLGLRGLYRLAHREGDREDALKHLRQARNMHPHTPWVLSGLFEVNLEVGDLDAALDALGEMQQAKQIDKATATRRRAVIHTEKARRAHAAGDAATARDAAKRAHDLAPALAPAAAIRARVQIDAGEQRSAARTLAATWEHAPHPSLVALYLEARKADTPAERYKQLGRLVHENPNHRESHIALGRAALAADQFAEAREHLTKAAGEAPTESVCRLMAELEAKESGDPSAGRDWLLRAADAPDDPAWVCESCGAVAADWQGWCRNCGAFDSYAWRTPMRAVDSLGTRATHARLEADTAVPAAAEDAEVASPGAPGTPPPPAR